MCLTVYTVLPHHSHTYGHFLPCEISVFLQNTLCTEVYYVANEKMAGRYRNIIHAVVVYSYAYTFIVLYMFIMLVTSTFIVIEK